MGPLVKLIQAAQQLHAKNMLSANDGNLSVRNVDGSISITPSGKPKAQLCEKDFALVTLEGKILEGRPSSECEMHLKVYRDCPQAKCVIHAHPPHAIAWSLVHPEETELPASAMSELILAVGSIPIAPYARPGTSQMAEVLSPLIEDHRVLILARHGALCWGESIMEAYQGMERLEHSAQILCLAKSMGALSHLPPEEVQYLKTKRKELGPKTL